jgi:hypothetical protein
MLCPCQRRLAELPGVLIPSHQRLAMHAGEVAMWSEHVLPSILDYAVWPRAAALAERLWSPAASTKVSACCTYAAQMHAIKHACGRHVGLQCQPVLAPPPSLTGRPSCLPLPCRMRRLPGHACRGSCSG